MLENSACEMRKFRLFVNFLKKFTDFTLFNAKIHKKNSTAKTPKSKRFHECSILDEKVLLRGVD